MIFGDAVDNDKSALFAKALDKIFTLHADHEQNASTAAVRLVGSAGSNLFASLSAGVATLWGPAHGGANEAVINMLKEIEQSEDIDKFIEKAKDDKDPFKLMGFGHRVYKNYDPRARILKDACHEVLSKLEQNNELLKIAKKLEEIALKDEYFIVPYRHATANRHIAADRHTATNRHTAAVSLDPANKQRDDELLNHHLHRHTAAVSLSR
uniref:Citrate synthase n=1 Tax=Timema poppense TaxID=170557 RepID=A0A7R9DMM4_TIMPO|nr:unnamed protein product [Timema poppensis]